jgi:hypothetical protein
MFPARHLGTDLVGVTSVVYPAACAAHSISRSIAIDPPKPVRHPVDRLHRAPSSRPTASHVLLNRSQKPHEEKMVIRDARCRL